MRLQPRTFAAIAIAVAILGSTVACATSTPIAQPTPSATPTATPTPTVAAGNGVVPTDCSTLLTPEDTTATFADMPLNDPMLASAYPLGVVKPTAPAADATPEQVLDSSTQLRCLWRDPQADVTYLEVSIGTVDPDFATSYVTGLPAADYTCANALEGIRCQIVGTSPLYPVQDSTTVFLRDDIYIHVGQANFPTDDLLGKLVTTIWG